MLSDSIFIREAAGALLAAGADPNLRDKQGRTPLLCALDGEWPWQAANPSVGQLIAAGARTDAIDNKGNTALHYLARMGRQSPMFFLGQAASQFALLDVNATNSLGVTPLDLTRPGMSVWSHWSGPFGSPGIKLAASFRSMGLSQLEGLASVRPSHFGSQSDPTMAAMLQRAGGVYGTASPGWRPR